MDEYDAKEPDELIEHWNHRTVDRDALLKLADELDEVQRYLTSGKMMDPQDAAKRIREACGKDDK